MLLGVWWNLPEELVEPAQLRTPEGTPKAAQGLQGNSAESSLHPELRKKPAKTFGNPFGIAGWLIKSRELSYRQER